MDLLQGPQVWHMLRTEINSTTCLPAWEGPRVDAQGTGSTMGGASARHCPSPPSALQDEHCQVTRSKSSQWSCPGPQGHFWLCRRGHRCLWQGFSCSPAPAMPPQQLCSPLNSNSSTKPDKPATVPSPKTVWHFISGPQRGSGQHWYPESQLSSGPGLKSRARPPQARCAGVNNTAPSHPPPLLCP